MKIIKILAASFLVCVGITGCDLTGLNENPNKPTDDVDYNMNEPRLASTLRGGVIMDGDIEERSKQLQIDLYSQMTIDGGKWGTKNYIMNDEWNSRIWDEYLKQIASLNIVIRSSIEKDKDLYANSIAVAKSGVSMYIARQPTNSVPCLSLLIRKSRIILLIRIWMLFMQNILQNWTML